MDDLERVRSRGGLVTSVDLGDHPARAAASRRLVPVQPRVHIAETQPVDAAALVTAVGLSLRSPYAFLGRTALWLEGVMAAPEVVEVGVRHGTRFRGRPPVLVRRVAPEVLRGVRPRAEVQVVALEVAVVQATARCPLPEALPLIEQVLRERRTTVPRLRSRLRRGLVGSAVVRRALDELVGTSLDGAVRRLRSALEERGVTGLEPEVHFTSATGASAYGDLVDEQSRTVVEVDGYLTHIERARFRADRRRDRWLTREHGLLTVRVDAAETVDDLPALADELAALLRARRTASARLA